MQEQIPRGTTFFANNEHGIRLAEEIVDGDGLRRAGALRQLAAPRLTSTRMRLARAYRGRDKILKFEGGYHGMSDYGLMSLAPKRPATSRRRCPIPRRHPAQRAATRCWSRPSTTSRPRASLIARASRRARRHHRRAVPAARSRRRPASCEGLREITTQYGIPLIFDEVVTGFRFAYGGAQAYYGVTPDLCTLGKIIGGGFPLAAIAGRADIMAHFDRDAVGDDGFMTQVGTLSGNPIAAVAGLADPGGAAAARRLRELFATGRDLMAGAGEDAGKAPACRRR